MDISLGISCFVGIGFLINSSVYLKNIIQGIGSLFLLYIGIKLFLTKSNAINKDKLNNQNHIKMMRDVFIVTWLNPQAILDGSILFGSFRASLPPPGVISFIIGICLASTLWFLILTTLIGSTKKVMTNNILSHINKLCGLTLIYFGIEMLLNFLK
jgi:L-lysine exporter family protein LysE/ArgO